MGRRDEWEADGEAGEEAGNRDAVSREQLRARRALSSPRYRAQSGRRCRQTTGNAAMASSVSLTGLGVTRPRPRPVPRAGRGGGWGGRRWGGGRTARRRRGGGRRDVDERRPTSSIHALTAAWEGGGGAGGAGGVRQLPREGHSGDPTSGATHGLAERRARRAGARGERAGRSSCAATDWAARLSAAGDSMSDSYIRGAAEEAGADTGGTSNPEGARGSTSPDARPPATWSSLDPV